MKKILVLLLTLIMISGCNNTTNGEYFGDFENDKLYQEIMQIENCTNPDELAKMLEDLYGEAITYISLDYDEQTDAFKSPYEDMKFNVYSVYSATKNKGAVMSDAYAFFKEYHESPCFIMDKDGAYLVSDYRVITHKKDDYEHIVDAWATSDLYLCLHGYADCDGNQARRKAYENTVKSMAKYTDFEALLNK